MQEKCKTLREEYTGVIIWNVIYREVMPYERQLLS